ncbi:MAG: hypothetical protein AB8E15_02440 [Bdellovibrionales bacterium]
MNKKYEAGEEVELRILRETDLGFVAEINGLDQGLLYHEEIFEQLDRNQRVPGYIKKIRNDGAIDLILQNLGNLGTDDLANNILKYMKKNGGSIPVNSKSPAEKIHDLFLVSRNKFKMALGNLYKKRLVEFDEEGTSLTELAKKP